MQMENIKIKWEEIIRSNIHLIIVSEGKITMVKEETFEKLVAQNFPESMQNLVLQIEGKFIVPSIIIKGNPH